MTQYILCAFSKPKDAEGNDIPGYKLGDVISAQIQKLGETFPVPLPVNGTKELVVFQSTNQLMEIADDLEKLDTIAYSLLTRTARMIGDLQRKIAQDNAKGWGDLCPGEKFAQSDSPALLVTMPDGDSKPISDYVILRDWDTNQNAVGDAIKKVYDTLATNVSESEETIRKHSADYTDAGNTIQSLRRRGEGSLLVKNLDELGSSLTHVTDLASYQASLASNNKIYVDTSNLKTVLIVVKKSIEADFKKTYDLDSCVVPESLQELASDNEFVCCAVTIKAVNFDEFKNLAREKAWHVREFKYNPNLKQTLIQEAKAGVDGYLKAVKEYAVHLQSTFSHMTMTWMQIKLLRLFVEAKLLYGIQPNNFEAFLIKCSMKNVSKIHGELEKKFADGLVGGDAKGDDDADYHPYVSFDLNLNNLLPQ